jgi:hypothetical protein
MSKTSILTKQYNVVEKLLNAADLPSGSNKAHARKIGMSNVNMVLKPKYAHLKGPQRPRMATFGKVFNVSQGRVAASRCNKMFPDLYTELKKLGKMMRPSFEFENIHVNKNTISERHVDGGQHGVSMIVGLGDYTDGYTVVYKDKDDNKGKKYNINRKPLLFDADTVPHESTPYEGTRYSIIYFPQNTKNITNKTITPVLGDADTELGYHVMVVPTNRNRAEWVVSRTLQTIRRMQRGHLDNVSIFVDTKAEAKMYTEALEESQIDVLRVVATGQTGVQKRRMWAHRHAYKTDTKLINIDDTVLEVTGATLQSMAKRGFAMTDTRVWTVGASKGDDVGCYPMQYAVHGVYAADPTVISCFPRRIAKGAVNEGNEVVTRACVRYGGVGKVGGVEVKVKTGVLMQDYSSLEEQRADKAEGTANIKAKHPELSGIVR